MHLFLIRIIVFSILGMGGGIFTCVYGNWGLGAYLIGWTFNCCYQEIRVIFNNDPACIEYRIMYPDKKI
jgi:hypothetical protein